MSNPKIEIIIDLVLAPNPAGLGGGDERSIYIDTKNILYFREEIKRLILEKWEVRMLTWVTK